MINMVSTHFTFVFVSVLLWKISFVSALSKGDVCTDNPTACEAPLSCVGKPNFKKCFMKKGLNKKCGQDPFWVCQEGLTCVDGVCVNGVGVAELCNSSDAVCTPPLSCVGPEGGERCFMKKGLNMECGQDPFWVCEDGLMCVDNVCVRAIGVAGACTQQGAACTPPLSCVGPKGAKRCFMKKGLNMECGQDPYWVCEDDLMCIDGTCKTPVDRAGSCSDPDTGCIPPFTCAGPSGSEKCVKLKYRGMKCDDSPFSVCAPHLTCVYKICKQVMINRGKCGINFQICMPPLSCVGTPELKRCVMKKGLGMVCGKDPYWVCEDDLECVDHRCQKK